MRLNVKIAMLVGVGVVIAAFALVIMRHRNGAPAASGADAATAAPAATAHKALYWYDPMHPSQHFDKPGKSPFMDMQLVPKYADGASASASASVGAGAAPAGTAVDSRIVQSLGLRFAQVELGRIALDIDAVGLVGVDEHRIVAIQVRESGWVEQLDVRAAGDTVRRGQRLAGVYSPNLLATQQELLIARGSGDPQLIEAAHQRLMLFGLSARQIARVEKTGEAARTVDYYAPFDGYVMELGARQGAAVEPGATLFQLVDSRSVWIIAEVPEAQAAWINAGDTTEVEIPALPGERFAGKVDYLYPELAQATRTLKARVIVSNTGKHLRPGMFAAVHFRGALRQQVLTVPTEAVINTGTRSVVIVVDDSTHFRPASVRVGAERAGRSEILEGLSLGQSVVTSGQFLIDSEANLRSAFDNLAGSGGSH